MSKAAELAALIGSQTALSNRNLIINGAMQVAQRGTSFGTLSSQAYTLDRWIVDAGATVQQASLSVDEITNDTQLTKAIQMQGASSDYFLTRIEDVTKFSNQTFTLSFYVKGSSATTLNNIYARQTFGSGGSSLVDTALSNVSYSVTTSYTRYTATVTIPSISGKTVGTGSYLELFMLLPDSVTVYITGIQLEVGEQATPFEHRNYGDELIRCQRYYQSIDYYFDRGSTGLDIFYYTNFSFPVTMRATPSMTASSWGSNTGSASTRYGSTEVNGWIMNSAIPTGCLMSGNHANIYNKMTGRGKFDAEL